MSNYASGLPKLGGIFDLEGLKTKVGKLEVEMSKPDFWQHQDRARVVSKQAEDIRSEVSAWEKVEKDVNQTLELLRAAETEGDTSLTDSLEQEVSQIEKQLNRLEMTMLFSGKYDQSDAIIMIHAGAGGVEAQDWAEMLQRMLLRYAESQEFSTQIVNLSRGHEAGIKSATIEVYGRYAYGKLRSEAGVHRLVRISPFDAEKMRHTSFALVEIIPILPEHEGVVINEKDLRIETMRAGGHGGQSVNTTDSAVRITHIPTGLTVRCQNERSQIQNRQTALKIIQAKLTKLQEQLQGKELNEIRGEVLAAEWGNQIRSYVLQPYKQVKDHRTGTVSQDPDDILGGQLDEFVESYLRWQGSQK